MPFATYQYRQLNDPFAAYTAAGIPNGPDNLQIFPPIKQHLDWFSSFRRVQESDQQTHRRTDHTTLSVAAASYVLSWYNVA